MKRNEIHEIQIFTLPAPDGLCAAERASRFRLGVVERRLEESGLSAAQKAQLLDRLQQLLEAGAP